MLGVFVAIWFCSVQTTQPPETAGSSNPLPQQDEEKSDQNRSVKQAGTEATSRPIWTGPQSDRYKEATIVSCRDTVTNSDGTVQRIKILQLKKSAKYPLVRVEETIAEDPQDPKHPRLVSRKTMVADHVIVGLRPEATLADLGKLALAHGGKIRRKLRAPNMYLVEIPAQNHQALPAAINAFSRAASSVAFAEPDYIVSIVETTPNDAKFDQLWGLHNTGQTGGKPGADIKAVNAWDLTRGSRSVRVGIIDTGIEYTHPDLAANIWTNPGETGLDAGGNDRATNGVDDDGNGFLDDVHGWDFANNDNDPMDDHFHGTHVAGTVGGNGNNGEGVVGVSWEVTLIALKFLGGGGSGMISDAVEAVYYATNQGVHLTSNSWGGGGFSVAMETAIEDARQNDILFIAAAGNSNQDTDLQPHYPSNYNLPNVISVAATDHNDLLASFSSYGPTTVHLAAPGVATLSCGLGGSYRLASGTSMATPHVSGVCALIKAINPAATSSEIKDQLVQSVDVLPQLEGKVISGGRLNALKALLFSTGAYLSFSSTTFDDDTQGASQGNADGTINPGERIELQVNLINRGRIDAGGVTATLAPASANPNITMIQGVATYGTVPSAGEASGVFVLEFDSGIPTPSTIRMRLDAIDGNAQAWAIEFDLEVLESSLLGGQITEAGSGIPVAGATIEIDGPVSGTRTSGTDGRYLFGGVAGSYTIQARRPGVYLDSMPVSVTIPPDRSDIDFVLGAPNLVVNLNSFNETASMGDVLVSNLTLQNTGNVPLQFSITSAAQGTTKAGDLRRFFSLDRVTVRPYDCAFQGNELWITHGPFSTSVTRHHPSTGHVTGLLDLAGVVDKPYGIAWDQAREKFWITDYWANQIYCIDPATGQAVKSFPGPNPSPGAGPQGIEMVDGQVCVLVVRKGEYLGGYRNDYLNTLYKLNADTGAVEGQLEILQSKISGVLSCFTFLDGLLWFPTSGDFDRPGTFEIWMIDPSDGRIAGSQSQPNYHCLGASTDGQGNLWITNYLSQKIYQISTGRSTWLSALPTAGEVAAGGNLGVSVRMDSLKAGLGDHSGTLRILCNDIDSPVVSIPVALSVGSGSNPPVAQEVLKEVPEDTPTAIQLTASDLDADPLTFTLASSPTHGSLQQQSISRTVWMWGRVPLVRRGDPDFTYTAPPTNDSGLVDVATLSLGSMHAMALKTDGSVWAWGLNQDGQLGDGSTTDRRTPVSVTGLTSGVTKIAAGSGFSLALKNDGTVWAWGGNRYGTLGDGSTSQRRTPVAVSGLANVIEITAGAEHAAALTADGNVWTWGRNYAGELGVSTSTPFRTVPAQVAGISASVSISAGNFFTLALMPDGTVWSWGYNGDGCLGDGTWTNRDTPVQVSGLTGVTSFNSGGRHTLAVLTNGTVSAWGFNHAGNLGDDTILNRNIPVRVVGLTNIVTVSAAGEQSLALTAGGRVYEWGYKGGRTNQATMGGYHEQFYKFPLYLLDPENIPKYTPEIVPGLYGVGAISAGFESAAALLLEDTSRYIYTPDPGYLGSDSFTFRANDGTFDSNTGTVNLSVISMAVPPTITSSLLAEATIGSPFAYRITADGTPPFTSYSATNLPAGLKLVGDAIYGTLTTPGVSNVGLSVSNAFGTDNKTLALNVFLSTGGTVIGWGGNGTGQLGDGTTIDRSTPVSAVGLTSVRSLAPGGHHTLAVLIDGSVMSWGMNVSGQLGDGTTTAQTVPHPVPGLANMTHIASGRYHSLARRSDGRMYVWGEGDNDRLGLGNTNDQLNPILNNLSGITGIAAGLAHSLALTSSGSVRAWGWNSSGQIGVGDFNNRSSPATVLNLSNIEAVAAGWYHTLFLASDGTVWSCGSDTVGQLGYPHAGLPHWIPEQIPNLTNVVAVAAGLDFSLVLKADGSVWGFGKNETGQLGDLTTTNRDIPVRVHYLDDAIGIAAGWRHGLALRRDGTVWSWGRNDEGQLGNAHTGDQFAPVRVKELIGAAAVAANANSSFALQFQFSIHGSVTHQGTPIENVVISDGVRYAVSRQDGTYVLSGVPNGSYTLTATRQGYNLQPNGWSNPVSVQFADVTNIDFKASIAPKITSPLKSRVRRGELFKYTITATGDTPLTFKAETQSGVLPVGITHVNGVISGVPQEVGSATITLRATNSAGSDQQELALDILPEHSEPNEAPRILQPPEANPNPVYLSLASRLTVVAEDRDGPENMTFLWSKESGPGQVDISPNGSMDAHSALAKFGAPGNYLIRVQVFDGSLMVEAEVDVTVLPGPAHAAIWAWGLNSSGQLGDGSKTARSVPIQQAGMSGAWAIAGKGGYGLALKAAGEVWGWGGGTVLSPKRIPGAVEAFHVNGRYHVARDGQVWQADAGMNGVTRVEGLTGVIQVSEGLIHSLALLADGSVWCWKTNVAPYRIEGLEQDGQDRAISIAAGKFHRLVLREDGTVWAWGNNGSGQLGDGTTQDSDVPVQVINLAEAVVSNFAATAPRVIGLAAGGEHSLAFLSNGDVWAWGSNYYGQLGDGTKSDRWAPVRVREFEGTVAVFGENRFSAALKNDGTVWAWGDNSGYQHGDGTTDEHLLPKQVPGLFNILSIAGGESHMIALQDAGTPPANLAPLVYAGPNRTVNPLPMETSLLGEVSDDFLPDPPMLTTLSWAKVSGPGSVAFNPVDAPISTATFSAEGTYVLRLLANDGALTSSDEVTVTVNAPSTGGTLWAWGANSSGQLGDGSTTEQISPVTINTISGVTQISAGYEHTLALKSDGTVWAWGTNSEGRLGDGTVITRLTPVLVGSLGQADAVSAGGRHSLALLSDGTVWAWGYNGNGQLGDDSYGNRATPVQVVGLTNVAAISAGNRFSMALKQDGTVWGWGHNYSGQLGNGIANGEKKTPVQTQNLSGVTAISAGFEHTLALKGDGTLWAWGRNAFGQLGIGSSVSKVSLPQQITALSSVTRCTAGTEHSLAVLSNGTVQAWGYNNWGQLGDGTNTNSNLPVTVSGLSGVVALSAENHSLALTAAGEVWGWGYNGGRIGDGTTIHRDTPVQVVGISGANAIDAGTYHSMALYNAFEPPPNTAPVAQDQAVATDEDTPKNIKLVVLDPEGNKQTYSIENGPQNGTLTGTAPNLFYSPNEHYHGLDSFTFKSNDGEIDSNVATVSIVVNAINDAPLAAKQWVIVKPDVAKNLTLDVSDADNDPLTLTISQSTVHGSLSGTAPNLTYTPSGGYSGYDCFVYKADDGQLDSGERKVEIFVSHGFTIQKLASLDGTSSVATDINDAGVACGYTNTSLGAQAVRWIDGGVPEPLGTMKVAEGINNSGAIVGSTKGGSTEALRWEEGIETGLGFLPNGYGSSAREINEIGWIVGSGTTRNPSEFGPGSVNHAFIWKEGLLTDLGTLGGKVSVAFGINDSGQVVGESYTRGPFVKRRPFIWENGFMTALGNLGQDDGAAESINELGQVVGWSRRDDRSWGRRHAFLWFQGDMVDLGTLGGDESYAKDVNDLGLVVGEAAGEDGPFAAFLWQGGMVDLHLLIPEGSGWNLRTATAINNKGWIVGYGTLNGNPKAFLLRPGLATNMRPTVDAGPHSVTELGSQALLQGRVFDDGLPQPPGTVTSSWSKVSGTGSVTFVDAAAAETSASFSAVGTYVLRLTANDGTLSAYAEVSVEVRGGQDITTDLVGHWTFEEGVGNTAADSSGAGNHGTVVEAQWAAGHLVGEKSLYFGGIFGGVSVDYMFGNTNGFATGGGARTFAGWVKIKQNSFYNTYLFGYGLFGQPLKDCYLGLRQGRVALFSEGRAVSGSKALDLGRWYHVAATTQQQTVRIYLDGQLEAVAAMNLQTETAGSDFFAGAMGGGFAAQWNFDGWLDEVRIYRKALSPTEIQALAQGAGNQSPIANNSSITVTKNSTKAVVLEATDPDLDTLTFAIVVNPVNGALSGTPPNLTYTPNANYSGSDSFTFKANDGQVDSNTATVSITVDPVYDLTITSGSGDGSYTFGTVVNISADAPAIGKVFDKWTGDVAGIANVNASSTSLTMPAANASVTAIYKNQLYALSVTSGGGDGSYTFGTVVNISADAPATGKVFDKWTGGTAGITDVNASSTTLTMPAATTSITATYKDITYTLTVTSGSGDGSYTSGTVVNIVANPPSAGQVFDQWTGNTGAVTDVNAASTTLAMPSSNASVTATYKAAPPQTYSLNVTSGSGDGTYTAGTVVNISGDAPATGKVFDKWTGGDALINNVNASSTTLTMPAADTSVSATYKDQTYTLTVASGSGDGSYTAGSVVNISADAPATGKVFDAWTGDTGGVANVNTASTTLTMPSTNASLTATYKDQNYTLTVNSGSGDGSYTYGTVVSISAAPPAAGKVFDAWTGDTGGIANVNSASTNLTMPAAHAAVTATYKDQSYTLTVTSGSGDGSYTAGTVVNISAAAPPSGNIFDRWTGDVGAVANVNAANTTLNMPGTNTTITATYKIIPPTPFTLSVNNGSGDGSYTAGMIVNISADAPATGKVFDQWTGAIAGIASVNSASTTLTMPAANTSVTATYKDQTYTLTVTNGSGDGIYTAGTAVNISAGPPPGGQVFDQWTGDLAGVVNVNAADTSLTMSAANTTVMATYKVASGGGGPGPGPPPTTAFTLTVQNGTGSGTFTPGTVVSIAANAPTLGDAFKSWAGDISGLTDSGSPNTTLTMPAANVSLAATYHSIARQVVIQRAILKVNFSKTGKDLCKLQGTLDVPEGFDSTGAKISVDVGGATRTFTLDSKGKAKSSNGMFRLKNRRGAWTFKLLMKLGTWSNDWKDEGMVNETIKAKPVTARVVLQMGGEVYIVEAPLSYTARTDKKGTAR